MKDGNLIERLILFIRQETRTFEMPISRDSVIEDHLGVTGEDATDLIVNYSKKFNVDIHNFFFTKYFYDEPTFYSNQNGPKKILTVGHLEKGIIAGRLDEEVIDS